MTDTVETTLRRLRKDATAIQARVTELLNTLKPELLAEPVNGHTENAPTRDPVARIERMIQNGVISDFVDLNAEIRGYYLDEVTADLLRGKLQAMLEEHA